MEWVDIPGGDVRIIDESEVERGPNAGKIEHLEKDFTLEPFRISRYAVSNADYQAFIDDPGGYANKNWWRISLKALEYRKHIPLSSGTSGDQEPRTQVSWFDALAYCRWLAHTTGIDVTLPTEPQWLRAFDAQCGMNVTGVWEWCLPDKIEWAHAPRRRDAGNHHERIGIASPHPGGEGFRLVNAPLHLTLPPVDDLLARIPHETDLERSELIDQLGVTGDPRAVDLLIGELQNPGAKHGAGWPGLLREAAARALGHIGDARAIGSLVPFLGDGSNKLQQEAVDALVRIGPPAFDPVVAVLRRGDPRTRIGAVKVLGGLSDPRAIEPILALVRDKNEMLARLAQNNLKILIPQGMNHPDKAVRHAAEQASKALGKLAT
jgi:hypothetical protein